MRGGEDRGRDSRAQPGSFTALLCPGPPGLAHRGSLSSVSVPALCSRDRNKIQQVERWLERPEARWS